MTAEAGIVSDGQALIGHADMGAPDLPISAVRVSTPNHFFAVSPIAIFPIESLGPEACGA